MAATAPTSLCNVALRRIGVKSIDSLEYDQSRAAKICRELYQDARRAALALHPWRGATRLLQLSINPSITPVFFDHAFYMPEDYIRLVSVHPTSELNTTVHYSLQDANDTAGDLVLLTDVSTVFIKYVFDQMEIGVMGQGFRDVLCFLLARELAGALRKDAAIKRFNLKELQRALLIAKHSDSMDVGGGATPGAPASGGSGGGVFDGLLLIDTTSFLLLVDDSSTLELAA